MNNTLLFEIPFYSTDKKDSFAGFIKILVSKTNIVFDTYKQNEIGKIVNQNEIGIHENFIHRDKDLLKIIFSKI